MNCRGREKRLRIVEEYEVKPVAHIKLLMGQSKHSDAEATIKDEYYIFYAKNKINDDIEIIQCGMGAARDFLNILGVSGLPLYNPLRSNFDVDNNGRIGENNAKSSNGDKWNATARQLYNAIMWLIIAWDAEPNTPLFKFRDEILKYKKYNPFDSKIKRVNTVISKGREGKTLTDIVQEFRTNNDIKDEFCDFSLLNDRMIDIISKDNSVTKSFF